MRRHTKIAVAFLTVWPIGYGVWFLALIVPASLKGHPGDGLPISAPVFIALHLVAALDVFGLYVFYMLHAWRNQELGSDRSLWLGLIFFVGLFVMPVYWVRHIWPQAEPPKTRRCT